MHDQSVDILIVGGGIVGAAMLHALTPLGYRVLLIDAREQDLTLQDEDARCLTLSWSSMQILTQLGLWPALDALVAPIRSIHVSERKALGRALIQAPATQPLGCVIPINSLHKALREAMPVEQVWYGARLTDFDLTTTIARIERQAGVFNVTARLVIAADGADSALRGYCKLLASSKDYEQHALVANISLTRCHKQCAYERFVPPGLIALIPQKGLRAGLVWTASPEQTARALAQTDTEFLHTLQQVFGYRLGRFKAVGRREVHPLRQIIMPQQVSGHVVFIGNAAHTIHPVAGQGFNLGLRDVAMLAQCIAKLGIDDALNVYQQQRQRDQQAIIDFTDGLSGLYASSLRSVRIIRQLGLVLFDNHRGLKHLVARYASGLGGVVPDLVCGIPLMQT